MHANLRYWIRYAALPPFPTTPPISMTSVFSGVKISVTQVVDPERSRIAATVTEGGGVCSGTLETNTTTHLIALEQSGPKYTAAIAWNIPVVHPSWLEACVTSGTLVDETGYSLEAVMSPASTTPTDTRSSAPPPCPSNPPPRESFPPPAPRPPASAAPTWATYADSAVFDGTTFCLVEASFNADTLKTAVMLIRKVSAEGHFSSTRGFRCVSA